MKSYRTSADQSALVSACRDCIENIGKITLGALSISVLFISAKFSAHWPVSIGSVKITEKWVVGQVKSTGSCGRQSMKN